MPKRQQAEDLRELENAAEDSLACQARLAPWLQTLLTNGADKNMTKTHFVSGFWEVCSCFVWFGCLFDVFSVFSGWFLDGFLCFSFALSHKNAAMESALGVFGKARWWQLALGVERAQLETP